MILVTSMKSTAVRIYIRIGTLSTFVRAAWCRPTSWGCEPSWCNPRQYCAQRLWEDCSRRWILYSHDWWVPSTLFCVNTSCRRWGWLCCRADVHVLHILAWQKPCLGSSIHKVEHNCRGFYGDRAAWGSIERLYAKFDEHRAGFRRTVVSVLHRCADNVYRRWDMWLQTLTLHAFVMLSWSSGNQSRRCICPPFDFFQRSNI